MAHNGVSNIVAIHGSPRAGGNTDLLLQAFLEGVQQAGARARQICLRELRFSPCIECGGCNETGVCVLHDDLDPIYPLLLEARIIVLAAPVFFYGLNAQAKALVDRCQCCWVRRYLLKQDLSALRGHQAEGIVLSVGGSRGKKNFDGLLLTARYFFDALDCHVIHTHTHPGIDTQGAIRTHPSALRDAQQLGYRIATRLQSGA